MKITAIILLLVLAACNSTQEHFKDKETTTTVSEEKAKENQESASNCLCTETNPLAINCDTTFLTNKNFVYWTTTCDSSKLVFEALDGSKAVLQAFGADEIEFSGRIGKTFIKEFQSGLLFQHRWISGCCMAPDYILIDKKTGAILNSFPSSLNLYFNSNFNFLVTFKDSTLQELSIYNFQDQNSKVIKRFSKKVATELRSSSQQTADLFSSIKRVHDGFLLPFKYFDEKGTLLQDSIFFKY